MYPGYSPRCAQPLLLSAPFCMPYTLLLRLAGPMQAWGVGSRFSIRETLAEPSKSGVIGLLCAALGWDRAAPTHLIAGRERRLTDLAALSFGIRVVREGVLQRDYHTAQDVLRAKARLRPGKPVAEGDRQPTVLSDRFYLSDAYFLAGLESDDQSLLRALNEALDDPYWPLWLGRKSFVPSLPVRFGEVALNGAPASAGVVPLPLTEALLGTQDPAWETLATGRRPTYGGGYARAAQPFPCERLVLDADVPTQAAIGAGFTPTRTVRHTDVPLSFEPRRFAPREATTYLPSPLSDVPVQA
jgi:CRISPR system Cascade subunit CasD